MQHNYAHQKDNEVPDADSNNTDIKMDDLEEYESNPTTRALMVREKIQTPKPDTIITLEDLQKINAKSGKFSGKD